MDDTAAEHIHRIRTLDAQWLAAAARRDLDGMMEIYAPDARELLPDVPPLIGKKAIRGFYANLMEQMPRFAHHFDAQEITVGAAGDLAVVRGTYRFIPDVQGSLWASGAIWEATGGSPSTSRTVIHRYPRRLRLNKRKRPTGLHV
jgi:uncharacterized protein (TIGR02246 family)